VGQDRGGIDDRRGDVRRRLADHPHPRPADLQNGARARVAAQVSAGTTLYLGTHFGFPISTTHVVSGSVMGAGATRRLSAVRRVAGNIVFAWLLTLPAAGLVTAALYYPVRWVF
jgi:phosphate/sulfate permease